MDTDAIEEALAGFCADLVSFKHNEAFLKRLFQEDAGTMLWVRDLGTGMDDIASRTAELERTANGSLRTGWLEFSNSPYGEGYAIILFFVEEIFWHTLALFNRNTLEKAGHVEL